MPKIIIFLVLVSVSVFGQNAETIDKLVTYEKWNGAHKAALEWIQKDSKNPEAYLSASKVFIALKNIDSAALFINKGLEVSPESPYLYAGKISIAFLKKENSSVPGLVEKAKDFAKRKDSRIQIELAEAFLKSTEESDKVEFKKFIDEAIKLDKSNYKIYLLLGDFYSSQAGMTSDAVQNYQAAIDRDKNNSLKAYIQKAMVYDDVDNFEEAYNQYLKAIKVAIDYPVVYNKLAEMFFRAKDYIRADTTYDLYMKYTEPGLSKIKRGIMIAAKAKNNTSAIARCKQVLEAEPNDVAFTRFLATSYNGVNDSANALSTMNQLLKSAKEEETTVADYDLLGKLLKKFKQDSLAINAFIHAFAKDSSRSDLLGDIGEYYFNKRNFKEAQHFLGLRFEKFRDSKFQDLYRLGKSYMLDSAFTKARDAFDTLCAKYPKLNTPFQLLAGALIQISADPKDGLAKDAFTKFIELTADKVKFKNDLITAHWYLGNYYYNNPDVDEKNKNKKNFDKAKAEYTAILEIDPEYKKAKDALDLLDKIK